MQEGHKSNTK